MKWRSRDKLDVDSVRWAEAVAREAVIRPLASAPRLAACDVATAGRVLKLSRSRLYALIEHYRSAPVTSSLASALPVSAYRNFWDIGTLKPNDFPIA